MMPETAQTSILKLGKALPTYCEAVRTHLVFTVLNYRTRSVIRILEDAKANCVKTCGLCTDDMKLATKIAAKKQEVLLC